MTGAVLYISALEHHWHEELKLLTEDELLARIASVLLSAKSETLTDQEVDDFWAARCELNRRAVPLDSIGE